MGTEFQVFLAGPDPEYLRDAGNEALDEVERLEERLSHYRADSEVCDLNLRGPYGPVRMEPGLFALLMRAAAISRLSGGAFDCTAGPLVRCWGFFRGRGAMPDPDSIREALALVGSHRLMMDAERCTIQFPTEGTEVHLGAIGKGYAVDQVVERLRELGVQSALVHGGGSSIYALGTPPGAAAWEVGIRHPREEGRRLGVVRLKDRAFSTSGDYEQFFEVDGQRFSHILDPRSGYPARGVWSAAVTGQNTVDTDALSTAAFVLGVAGTRTLLGAYPDAGAVLVPDPGSAEAEVVVLGNVDVTLQALSDGDEE